MSHPEVLLGAAALGAAWVGGLRALGEPLRPARGLLFLGGLLAVVGALDGPVHDLAGERFAAHMVQHLLLTLVAAPALLGGTPARLLDAGLAPLLSVRHLGTALRTLTRPVPALGLHAAALVAWHLPGPFEAALGSDGWHLAEHASLGLTALLAWWPVVSPSRRLPALHPGAQILYLFVFGMPMTVVAAMITGAGEVLYPSYAEAARAAGFSALADQRLGGVLMWVPAGLVPLAAFTVVFFRWAAAEREQAIEPPGEVCYDEVPPS